jgi:hypothetical protein
LYVDGRALDGADNTLYGHYLLLEAIVASGRTEEVRLDASMDGSRLFIFRVTSETKLQLFLEDALHLGAGSSALNSNVEMLFEEYLPGSVSADEAE